jgi:hypothetical protein
VCTSKKERWNSDETTQDKTGRSATYRPPFAEAEMGARPIGKERNPRSTWHVGPK